MAVVRSTPSGWIQETRPNLTRSTSFGWLQETTGTLQLEQSRVTPTGWYVEGKTPNYSHVTPTGWQASSWTSSSEISSKSVLIPGIGILKKNVNTLLPGSGVVKFLDYLIPIVGSGGIKTSGAAIILKNKVVTASGSIKTSGAATTTFNIVVVGAVLIPGVGLVPQNVSLLIPSAGIVSAINCANYECWDNCAWIQSTWDPLSWNVSENVSEFVSSGGIKTSGSATTLLTAVARPNSDDVDGNWLPSTGVDLYSCIDEATPNNIDYIYTNSLSVCSILLSNVIDPSSSNNHKVNYIAKGDGLTDLVVRLKQGNTTIASWTETNAVNEETYYTHTLTTQEADSITDYSNLKLEFEAA